MAASQTKISSLGIFLLGSIFWLGMHSDPGHAENFSPAQQELLQQAANGFAQGNYRPAAAALPALASTTMGPWVAYWSLQPRLQQLKPKQFQQFSEQFPHGAAYELLRRQWLLELGKRQDWTHFQQVYLAGPAPENRSARCYAAMVPALAMADEASRLWLTASPDNQACNQMARQALAAGTIPTNELWEKLRTMVEEGAAQHAKNFASYLPFPDSIQLPSVLDHPQAWLQQGNGKHSHELTALAYLQMAWTTPAQAVSQLAAASTLSRRLQARVLYTAAGQAAKQYQSAQAMAWFQQALALDPTLTPSENTVKWLLRSALLEHNWALVLAAFARLPAAEQQLSRWRFWQALALQQQGNFSKAERIWQEISSPFDAYGQLALAALGKPVQLPAETTLPASSSTFSSDISTLSSFQRAITLYRLGLYFDALWEWRHLLAKDRAPQFIQSLATRAAQEQAWLLSINASTAIAQNADWRQGYVLPYRDYIESAAQENDLPIALLAGVMRQESGFAPKILSSAGAQGIMQIMPATANWVVRHLPQAAGADPQSVAGNIQIGSAYLAHLQQRLGPSPLLVAAAYNAGPNAVRKWLQQIPQGAGPWAGAIFAANIPYQQTRDYVLAVLANMIVYQLLLHGTVVNALGYWQLS